MARTGTHEASTRTKWHKGSGPSTLPLRVLTNGAQVTPEPVCPEEPAVRTLPSGRAAAWEVIMERDARQGLGQPDPEAIVGGPMDF